LRRRSAEGIVDSRQSTVDSPELGRESRQLELQRPEAKRPDHTEIAQRGKRDEPRSELTGATRRSTDLPEKTRRGSIRSCPPSPADCRPLLPTCHHAPAIAYTRTPTSMFPPLELILSGIVGATAVVLHHVIKRRESAWHTTVRAWIRTAEELGIEV